MILDNLPVILSLLAGFVVCVAMFIFRYEGTTWMLIVLGTLIGFYILGIFLRRLFRVILIVPENEEEIDDENEEDTDEDEAKE